MSKLLAGKLPVSNIRACGAKSSKSLDIQMLTGPVDKEPMSTKSLDIRSLRDLKDAKSSKSLDIGRQSDLQTVRSPLVRYA